MSFTLEQIYGCTRKEYIEATDTDPIEMIVRYEKEIAMLQINLNVVRNEYRNGGSITDNDQRTRADLIKVIEQKIKNKSEKVKDIRANIKGE